MPSQAARPPLVGMPPAWLRDNCPFVDGFHAAAALRAQDPAAFAALAVTPVTCVPVTVPGVIRRKDRT